jgi:quercetin dioxygenase-like cupin family protein
MSVIHSQEGQCISVLHDQVCIKLKSQDSTNHMSVITVDAPAGSMVAPHMHLAEEESYYMLAGSITVKIGDRETIVNPGDFVHIPAGTVHGYRNESNQPARFLAWVVGGELDQFFLTMGEQIRSVPEDLPKLPDILQRYNIQLADEPVAC